MVSKQKIFCKKCKLFKLFVTWIPRDNCIITKCTKCNNTVVIFVDKDKIDTNPRDFLSDEEKVMVDMYNQGYTVTEIMRRRNATQSQVKRAVYVYLKRKWG